MSADPAEGSQGPETPVGQPGATRRSRSVLDDVFGDVLPDATRDDLRDRDPDESDGSGASRREHELRRNVPPHHG